MKPYEQFDVPSQLDFIEISDDEVIRSIRDVPTHFGIAAFLEQLTQSMVLCGQIAPSNAATGVVRTGGGNTGIDMSVIRRLMATITTGVLGTNANVSAWFESSANANMAGNTNLGNTNVTGSMNLLLLNAVANANASFSLELRSDQLPAGHRYVQLAVNVATAASNYSAICQGGAASYHPANLLSIEQRLQMLVASGG